MKNIKKFVLLFVAFFPFITVCMQDCTHNQTSADVLQKDFMVCKELWSDFQRDFDFLHEHRLVDIHEQKNCFHNFLQDAFEKNSQEDEVDIGRVHIDILDFLWNCVKIPFYNVLNEESKKQTTEIDKIDDPVFLYVMHHSKSYFSLRIKEIINILDNDLCPPPLIMASCLGNIEMVKLLHDFGADVTIITAKQEIPFFCAIKNNRVEVAKFLIDHGSDINAIHPFHGLTALQFAIIKNSCFSLKNSVSDMLSMLLKKGADVNKQSAYNQSPLHYAVLHHHPEVVQLLIDEGANLEALSGNEITPIQLFQEIENIVAAALPKLYLCMQLEEIIASILFILKELRKDPSFDYSQLQKTNIVSLKYLIYLLESFDNQHNSQIFPFAHDHNLQVALYNEIKQNFESILQQELQSEQNKQKIEILATDTIVKKTCAVIQQLFQSFKHHAEAKILKILLQNKQIIEMLVTAEIAKKACVIIQELSQQFQFHEEDEFFKNSFALNNESILEISRLRYIFNKERKKYISAQRYKHFENQLKKDWR